MVTALTAAAAAAMWTGGFGFAADGAPIIRVGLATGLHEAVVMVDGRHVAGRIEGGTPATIRRVRVVERVGPPDTARVEGALAVWRTRGHADVRAYEQGAAYALAGDVVDTREALIAIDGGELPVLDAPPGGRVRVGDVSGPAVRVRGDVLRFRGRRYAGDLVLAADRDGRLAVVNEVDAETLLAGVVPAETYPSAPPAALEAQAVAARNQLLARLGVRHRTDPFHLCDRVHCQAYGGHERRTPSTDAAVAATRGVVLARAGRLVDTVYSASCGGFPATAEQVFSTAPEAQGGPAPDLDRPPDSWCAGGDLFRWRRTVPPFEVLDRTADGRVRRIRLDGRVVTGELRVRKALGGLPSALFNLAGPGLVEGGGHGHGAGMCQLGAVARAGAGLTAAEILAGDYGPDARLTRLW